MNASEPVVLDGLIEDVKRLSHSPTEMDWLNSKKSTKARITQGFGVNPIIMGEVEGTNRASSLAAEQHFAAYCVNPKNSLISETLTEYLSPMFGGDLVVWIDEVQPHDAEMALKWARLLCQARSISAPELRSLCQFELAEDEAFAGVLVGGSSMATTNPIQAGRRAMVHDAMAEFEADGILGEVKGTTYGSSNRFAYQAASPSGNGKACC